MPISTVSLETASNTWKAGTISPGPKTPDLEFLVGEFSDRLAEHLAGAIERIEVLRERRGEPPSQGRSGLCDSWCADCARCGGKACGFKKLSAVHRQSPGCEEDY